MWVIFLFILNFYFYYFFFYISGLLLGPRTSKQCSAYR